LSITQDIENEKTDFSIVAHAFYPLYFQNSAYKVLVNITNANLKKRWIYYLKNLKAYGLKCLKPPQLLSLIFRLRPISKQIKSNK